MTDYSVKVTISKFALASLLFTSGTASITLPGGANGILQGIERESGCGRSFILRVNVDGRSVRVLARTID